MITVFSNVLKMVKVKVNQSHLKLC